MLSAWRPQLPSQQQQRDTHRQRDRDRDRDRELEGGHGAGGGGGSRSDGRAGALVAGAALTWPWRWPSTRCAHTHTLGHTRTHTLSLARALSHARCMCVLRVAEGDALKQAIKLQIEYYLSRENLARDTFLLNQMNAQAYAPIELIAGFSKMKSFTTDRSVIVEAIALSSKLEVDESGSLVRPTDYEMPELKKKTTIILREVAEDVPEEQVRELFDEATFGPIAKITRDVGGFWFIEMENEVASDLLDKIREKQINGEYVKARLKTVSAAQALFGASPTSSAASPESSPTAMSAAQAQAAQYAYYPGYNPAYAGYAPQMYYNPQAAGRGAAPGTWGYMAWDPTMQGAVAAGQPGGYPAQGRGAGFAAAAGRGRGAAAVAAAGRGAGRGGAGAGRGAARGKATAAAAAPAPAGAGGAASGNGSSATSKSAGKKKSGAAKASAPKAADDVRPEALSLESAMDFPSLPGTPACTVKKSELDDPPAISKTEGVDSSIEAGESAPAPAPAAAGGWAQVAKKGAPKAAVEPPAVRAPVAVAAETAASERKHAAASGRSEGGDGTAAKPAAAVPAPAPAAAAAVPAPAPEPAPSSGPKSWAQMAGLRASDPVKQAPVVKQPKATEAPTVRDSLYCCVLDVSDLHPVSSVSVSSVAVAVSVCPHSCLSRCSCAKAEEH